MDENIDFTNIFIFGGIALFLAILIPVFISKFSAHKKSTLKTIVDKEIERISAYPFDRIAQMCHTERNKEIEVNGEKYTRLLSSNIDDPDRPLGWLLRVTVRIETLDKSEADYDLFTKEPPQKGLYSDGMNK